MSADSSRKRPKRTSAIPAASSFVKNVTERVSSLFPERVTKWFSSPTSVNVNGSVAAAEGTDSSSDDEYTANPPNPPKRMRFSLPQQTHQYNPAEANIANVAGTSEMNEPSSSHYSEVQSPSSRSTFLLEKINVSTPIRSEDSFTMKKEQDIKLPKSQFRVSSMGQSIANRREPVIKKFKNYAFKATPEHKDTETKKPYFKSSLLASPFYSGRTTYGGASSSYMDHSNISERKVAIVNKSKENDTITMSYATRKILDLIENYPSPLTEARRIPQYVKSPKTDKLTANSDSTPLDKSDKQGYKTRELYVPSIASILRYKQYARLMNTTSAARQLIASHSSTIDFDLNQTVDVMQGNQNDKELETESRPGQYKLKSKITRQNRGGDKLSEMIPPVNFSTAILQIDPDNLPNFSTTVTQSETEKSDKTSNAVKSLISPSESELHNVLGNINHIQLENEFVFSKPSPPMSLDSLNIATLTQSAESPKLKLKEQVHVNIKSTEDQSKNTDSKNLKKDAILSDMLKLKDWKCSECWVANKSEIDRCVCCGNERPSLPASKCTKCSVCKVVDCQQHTDKCVSCENFTVGETSSTALNSPKTDTQQRDVSLNNDPTANRSINCGAKYSNNINTEKQIIVVKTPGTDWKCDECWIMNTEDSVNCIACGNAKPASNSNKDTTGSSKVSSNETNQNSFFSSMKPTDDVFANFVNSQKSEKWSCSCCLVKNNNDQTSCVCCGSKKEGTQGYEKNEFQFNFNSNANKMKFGIFDNETQDSDVDNVMEEESLPEISKNIDSEPTNSNSGKTFSFINSDDKKDSSNENEKSLKPVFQFGIPNNVPIPPTSNPLLTQPSKYNNATEEVQLVPKVDFGTVEEHKPNSSMKFGIPVTKTENTTATIPFLSPLFSSEKKDLGKTPLSPYKASETNSVQEVLGTQNTFNYSASKPDYSANVFPSINPVSTAAVTTMSFVMPMKAVTTTAPISVMPMFQKSENRANSFPLFPKKDDVPPATIPLFLNSQPVITTALPTTVSAAPVFNFGGNSQSNTQGLVKPKFNFFSGNKTESSAMFKTPTFGTMADSNSGSNNFSLSSGTTLNAGNEVFGNILSGNALTSGGTIAGSTLPVPPVLGGSSEISTNAMSGGNSLQTSNAMPIIFGASTQKDTMWTPNVTNNTSFVPKTTMNTKPAPFNFGTPTPFNANNSVTTFGGAPQATTNIFGLSNQGTPSQPTLFSSPPQNQTAPSIFGNPTSLSNNSSLSMNNMFGTPNVGVAPPFGMPNSSIAAFENPSIAPKVPSSTPAFNFTGSQTSNILGFGQQQQQQPGVYNFGSGNAGSPQVQFAIGSSANTIVRKYKKAVRRNPQR